MRVVVTGGSGALGSQVVARIRHLGHVAIPVSRRWGVDLRTGQGLTAALIGADAVVHCASSPMRPRRTDVGGTAQLLGALAAMPNPAHLVYVSIVGCATNPYPYYRAKTRAEELILGSGTPATVVRATQFHSLIASLARMTRLGRTGLDMDVAVQPVDAGWFARELVDHALGTPPREAVRARDIAGPEQVTVAQVVNILADGKDAPAGVVRAPAIGGALRSFAAGTNLPGPDVRIGGIGFTQWAGTRAVDSPDVELSGQRRQHRGVH